MSQRIFVSHTHQDEPIANAIREAVRGLFGESVVVAYSTSKEHGGPRPGDNWIHWIASEVGQATIALILLTPASTQKPWVLWEAGAVAGTALNGEMSAVPGSPASRKVRPVAYQLRPEEIPSPFRHLQIVRGESPIGARQLFNSFIADLELGNEKAARAGESLNEVVEKYVAAVDSALLNAPMVPSEDVVQEWCLRLDQLKAANRKSEARYLHEWLNVAFGRERDGEPIPIDLRIHRRLGELYLDSRDYERAAQEFELGRRLAPRDIFLLRDLGRAYLGSREYEKTANLISRIDELDPGAFRHNVECAALKGRWLREQGRERDALAVYEEAYAVNTSSYYLGDLAGQMQLTLGERDAARKTYEGVLRTLKNLGEKNVWTYASLATASAVLGQHEAVGQYLELARAAGASPEEMNSINEGLARVAAANA